MTYQIDSKVDVHIEKRKRIGNVPGELIEEYKTEQIELCKIPVMVRSSQCYLNDENDKGIIRQKECMYDQGGYFIINGSEKVIVAQERQACNLVLVFNDKLPTSKYCWNAQVRSQNEENNKPALQFKLNIQKREKGGKIYATIPKIRTDIPVVILFRALGCESDKQIFNMVLSDQSDTNMSEAFRPSLEEAIPYQTKEDCLDYIA